MSLVDISDREARFLTWLSSQPSYVLEFVRSLPSDVLSPTTLKVVANGFPSGKSESCPEESDECIDFLRSQILGLLGREAAKAQRTKQTRLVHALTEKLSHLDDLLGDLGVVAYEDHIPQAREMIPTGVQPLDDQIRGLARGDLGVISMPSGRGKSGMLLRFTKHAVLNDYSVIYMTIADQSLDELIPRLDDFLLEEPGPLHPSTEILAARHARASHLIHGNLKFVDFTDRECTLHNVEAIMRAHPADLVMIDHGDDISSEFSYDPTITRFSLRAVYTGLKRLSQKFSTPIWTASQTSEYSWYTNTAGGEALSEAKTGKLTGSAVVAVFTGGENPEQGVMYCTLAKARRRFTKKIFKVRYDYSTSWFGY